MKKLVASLMILSLVCYLVFGFTFSGQDYLERFKNFPDFMPIFNYVVNAFKQVQTLLENFGSPADIFPLILGLGVILVELLLVPIRLIGYFIDVLAIVLPIGL